MPQILELKTVDGKLWARIPALVGEGPVHLWTEEEKTDLLARERGRCIEALHNLDGA